MASVWSAVGFPPSVAVASAPLASFSSPLSLLAEEGDDSDSFSTAGASSSGEIGANDGVCSPLSCALPDFLGFDLPLSSHASAGTVKATEPMSLGKGIQMR